MKLHWISNTFRGSFELSIIKKKTGWTQTHQVRCRKQPRNQRWTRGDCAKWDFLTSEPPIWPVAASLLRDLHSMRVETASHLESLSVIVSVSVSVSVSVWGVWFQMVRNNGRALKNFKGETVFSYLVRCQSFESLDKTKGWDLIQMFFPL